MSFIDGLIDFGRTLSGANESEANRAWNKKQFYEQIKANREDATTSYKRQQELLQNQQQFELRTSDPKFQMSRMRSAGINPNLIAGQISPAVNTPSVPSAPQASPASSMPLSQFSGANNLISNISSIFGMAQSLFNTKKTAKETKKIDYDIDKIKSELNLTDAQTEKVKHESELLIDEFTNLRPRQLKKLDEDTNQVLANIKKTLQDFDHSQQLFPDELLKLYYDTQNAFELLEQSKTNTTFLKKRLERFEKNFESIVNLDKTQLNAAYLQSQSAASASAAYKRFIDSINKMSEEMSNDGDSYGTMLNQASILLLNFLGNWFMGKMDLPNINLPADH